MSQYSIPGARPVLDQGATVQPWYLYPVGQPELVRYRELHRTRNQPEVVTFLQTLAPTITNALDWIAPTVEIVWT